MTSILHALRRRGAPWLVHSTVQVLTLVGDGGIVLTIFSHSASLYGYGNARGSQKCVVNGVLSKSRTLTCGIPQGTILGPLLFLLYINDLPKCLSDSQPRMYADDTHLTYADKWHLLHEASLNQDLSNINRWLIANRYRYRYRFIKDSYSSL